jgi:cytoskeletal protein RodZ
VEKATKLRARYLRALEAERFEELPPGGYRRTFLRTYATFLGLDADVVVGEYVDRYEAPELPAAPPPRRPAAARWLLLAAVLGLGLVVALAVALAGHGGSPPPAAVTTGGTAAAATTTTVARPATTTTKTAAPPARLRLVVTAVNGACWLSIHAGSAQGPVVYEDTLQQGEHVALEGRRFWARVGAPWNLAVTVDGKPYRLPTAVGDVTIG